MTQTFTSRFSADTVDWSRFDYYAGRVKEIHFAGFPRPSRYRLVTFSSAAVSGFRARAKPIFPTLQVVRWSLTGVALESFAFLDVFLCATIAHLTVNTSGATAQYPHHISDAPVEDRLIPALQTVQRVAPDLKKLHIQVWGTVAFMEEFHSIVSPLQSLEHLELFLRGCPMSRDALAALSLLPKLHTLRFCVYPLWGEGAGLSKDVRAYLDAFGVHTHEGESYDTPLVLFKESAAGPLVLPALELLELSSKCASHCATFLSRVALPSLVTLVLQVYQNDGLHEIFSAIDTCGHNNLFKILRFTDPFQSMEENIAPFDALPPAQTLQALKKFVNLEVLSLEGAYFRNADDAWVQDIADAWPNLQELVFGINLIYEDPKISLTGIHTLVERCPALRRLVVPFDVMTPEVFEHPLYRNTYLREVGSVDLTLDDHRDEAVRRLKLVFPGLRTVLLDEGGPQMTRFAV